MADNHDVDLFPDGVESNHGGPIPTFLKLTYVGFATFAVTYWVLYRAGDGSALVQAFNTLCN
jgi:hypothetical protein